MASAAVVRGQMLKVQMKLLGRLRPHLRVLHLTADSTPQLALFRKLLREVAGSLETLTIDVRNASRRQADMDSHIVPFSLFGGHATSLKSLTISSGYALVPTDSFPVLLHLHLSGFWHGQLFNDLPLLFRNSSSLQTFALATDRDEYWTRMDEANWGSGPIPLPSIQHFRIMSLSSPFAQGQQSLISDILSHIVFPRGATVVINQNSRYSRDHVPRLVMPQIGHHPVTSLTIEDENTLVTTRGDSTTYSITYAGRISSGVTRSHYPPPPPHASPFPGSEALLKSVQRLRIHSSYQWSLKTNVLSRLTGYTPFLTELVLHDFWRRELLLNLSAMLEYPDVILCPNLTTIVYISVADHTFRMSAADILFRATARRAERGYPLKRVTYCSPYNTQEYTLQNAHGVETISVLRRDVWAEYDDADKESHEQFRAVERARPQQHQPRTACDYGVLWQRCMEGDFPKLLGRDRRKWP
ncbi:hypothetical protein C8Q76DRAFT_745187 [Earliella scabrosa]|nr:hypothetical protein C8Q76DRAFT_745187 [Earliella scabrosa]